MKKSEFNVNQICIVTSVGETCLTKTLVMAPHLTPNDINFGTTGGNTYDIVIVIQNHSYLITIDPFNLPCLSVLYEQKCIYRSLNTPANVDTRTNMI